MSLSGYDLGRSFARTQETHKRPTRGGGGGGWDDRWKPPQDDPVLARILAGEYKHPDGSVETYAYYGEHFYATKQRGITCTGGHMSLSKWKYDQEIPCPCLGCYYAANGYGKAMSCTDRFVFNVALLVPCHLTEKVNRDGDVVRYSSGDREGDPIMVRRECESRGCKMCANNDEEVFGRHVHYSVSSTQLGDALGTYNYRASQTCRNCEGDIVTVHYVCPNDSCGQVALDPEVAGLKDADIYEAVCSPYECPHCRTEQYLIPEESCNKCQDPVRSSLYDMNLDIARVGKDTQTKITIFGMKSQSLESFGEEIVGMQQNPFNFDRIFTGPRLNVQADLLGLAVPDEWKQLAAEQDKEAGVTGRPSGGGGKSRAYGGHRTADTGAAAPPPRTPVRGRYGAQA